LMWYKCFKISRDLKNELAKIEKGRRDELGF